MAAGYFEAGKDRGARHFRAIRLPPPLPPQSQFLVAAGLAQAVEYLTAISIHSRRRSIICAVFRNSPGHAGFFEMLADLRFTGDLFAVPEGTPMFPGEPFLTLRAPLVEAQIPETYLLATIGFQSMIATKAARVVKAARVAEVVEFGTRRAHSPEAGVLAGRAACIGGCAAPATRRPACVTACRCSEQPRIPGSCRSARAGGLPATSAAAGRKHGVPDRQLRHAGGSAAGAELGRPLWGVRLDSGNLVELAPAVRKILDEAGLPDAKIMATGDLNEHKIHELVAAGAPIDIFGVGTELVHVGRCSFAGRGLQDGGDGRRPTAGAIQLKLSEDKRTLPGAKQISATRITINWRDADRMSFVSPDAPTGRSAASSCDSRGKID